MKKALALTCAMTMAASLFLTGCGGSDYTTMSGNGSDNNSGDSNGSGKRVVNVCSWGEYIDEDLIYKFEDETGIKVNYQTAESNEALYSLLKTGAGDYDVIVPSDYMIARLIDEGMLAELNYDNIPNYEKIGEQYKSLSFDPENKYTVPYTWGTLGIIYNSTMVDGDIDSWDAMFDEKYAGNVLMIRNSRDALAAALLVYGLALGAGVSRTTLVLAGLAVSGMLTAGMNTIKLLYPDAIAGASDFLVGGLSGVTLSGLKGAVLYLITGTLLALLLAADLNVLCLGEQSAASLGLHIGAVRFLGILAAALLAGAAVSFAGLLSFVGLLAPHIARRLVGNNHRILLPAAMLLGAAFVVLCDVLARCLFAPFELPVGILLSLIGGPFFLGLLLHGRGRRMYD